MATRPIKPTPKRTPPAGFDLKKYEPFKPEKDGSHDQLRKLWCNALLVRQTINKRILEGRAEEVRPLVDQLISDPTNNCGYSTQYVGAGYLDLELQPQDSVTLSYSQGTTWATSSTDLFFMSNEGHCTENADSDYIDDLYFDNVAGKYGPKGFLTVSLFASDDQIRSDFSRWLTAIRKSRSIKAPTNKGPDALIKKWSQDNLLPFLDVYHLWALTHNVKLQKLEVLRWLHPRKPILSLADFAVKTVPKAVKMALNPRVLSYLATSHRD